MSDQAELLKRIEERRLSREDLTALASREQRDDLLDLTLAAGAPELLLSASQTSSDLIKAYVEGSEMVVAGGNARVRVAATLDAQISHRDLGEYVDGKASEAEHEVITDLAKVDPDFDETLQGILAVRQEVQLDSLKVYGPPTRQGIGWVHVRIALEILLLATSMLFFWLSSQPTHRPSRAPGQVQTRP